MSEDLYELFFQSSNEGLALLDSNRKFKLVNESFATIVGYERKELIGESFEILVPHEVREKHKNHTKKFDENPSQRSMGQNAALSARHKQGHNVPVEISLNPIEINQEKCLALIVSNVSERAKIQAELEELNESLEKRITEKTRDLKDALIKEQELGELKSRFVSMVSHEFRTPLTTIKSSAHLLSKYLDSSDEKLSKHFGKIHRNIEHLNQMLSDILTLSRLDEKKDELDLEEIKLASFVDDCIEELEHLIQAKNLNVLSISDKDFIVHSDPKILKSILINLLTNAIKYSRQQGKVEVRTKDFKDSFEIKIIDDGIGISEQDQKRIFERFYRAKDVENIEGTGLGLEIVKQCLNTLNGTIACASEPKKGSIFTVKIPYAGKPSGDRGQF